MPIFKHCAKFAQCFFHAVLAHVGRAPVSKTGSGRFEPCKQCHAAGGAYPAQDRITDREQCKKLRSHTRKAVNELIDGFDAESVPGHLVADRLDSAGYSLALQMETDASAELVTGGTAMDSTAALTKANIYDTIVDARTKLSETHVPTDGRWLLVSPETYALLLKSPEFIKASALGDAVVQTGAVGRVAGFTVFEDTTLGEKVDFIAGHPNWFTRIEEWSEPVAVNDLKGSGTFIGACAVQGRKIYAHKVTKAQTVLVKSHA